MSRAGTASAGPMPIRVGVLGASGRMGRLVASFVEAAPDLELAARFERNLAALGDEARAESEVPDRLRNATPGEFDAVVDFTTARALPALAAEIGRLGCAWVSGTTGLDDAGRAAIARAAELAPVLSAPNFSLGVALLRRFLLEAARVLPDAFELEIVESHHARKIDAPSGTALALAETWKEARGGEITASRAGAVGPRLPREIGIHSVRLPEGVGEHRLLLGGEAESLELIHRAHDRAAFARGSLDAMRWLVRQAPGQYTVDDWLEDELGRYA